MDTTPSPAAEHGFAAFFLPNLDLGGAERVFLSLSGGLAERGYTVHLVLGAATGPLLAEVDPRVKIVDLGGVSISSRPIRFAMHTLVGLVRYLNRAQPRILFSTLTGANLVAILASLLTGRKSSLCIREAATLENVRSTARLAAMRLLYPKAGHIVALTPFMRDQLASKIHLRPDRITVIGNPLDTRRIVELAEETSDIDQIVRHKPYAICIGRLSLQKDHATAIRAIAQLPASFPLNLVLMGEGPLRQELESLARSFDVADRVFFIGRRDNPYPWLANASVFLMPSRWEGYPNALLEALFLGTPVVVTDYDPSVRTILKDRPRSRLVRPGDAAAMARTIPEVALPPPHPIDGSLRQRHREVLDAYESFLRVNRPDDP